MKAVRQVKRASQICKQQQHVPEFQVFPVFSVQSPLRAMCVLQQPEYYHRGRSHVKRGPTLEGMRITSEHVSFFCHFYICHNQRHLTNILQTQTSADVVFVVLLQRWRHKAISWLIGQDSFPQLSGPGRSSSLRCGYPLS